jgi:ComF family protein
MFPADPTHVNEKGREMSTIHGMLQVLGATLVSTLMPPVCCLCGAPGRRPDLDLCDVCTTFLPFLPSGGAPGSKAVAGGGTLLRTACLFKYEYPVDHFIRALKFRGERVFARVLGTLMARVRCEQGWARPAAIVPMPLHIARFRERGFNQAEEIARYAARPPSTAVQPLKVHARLLARPAATREQSGLSLEERRHNVLGAFRVTGTVPRGRIALLDDVVTSGSTALAAAKALLEGGADEVELWAVARVPSPFGEGAHSA